MVYHQNPISLSQINNPLVNVSKKCLTDSNVALTHNILNTPKVQRDS